MKYARWGLCLIFSLLSLSTANAQPRVVLGAGAGEFYRIEFEYRNWDGELISELEVGPGASNVSLTEDLGVPDERTHHFMGAVRVVSWLKVRGSYLKQEYDATATIRRDLTIGGTTLPALSDVDTSQSVEYTTIGAEGDLYASEYFVVSVVGDYTRFRAETRVDAEDEVDLGRREVKLLTLGLKLRIYLTPNLAVTGEANGMKREGSGVLTNLDGVVTYNLNRNLAISFGYQHRYARIDQGDREVFRLKGSHFGATVRF